MIQKHLTKLGILGALIAPTMASADALDTLKDLIGTFGQIVDLLLPIVFALAILAFFYGIMLYVFSQSGDSKKEGRGIMLWALVAIFVMASLFGIIRLAQSTLGITDTTGDFDVPGVQDL